MSIRASWREVVIKLWRIQDSKILWIRTIILLMIGLGELCLCAVHPCLMSNKLYDDGCRESLFWLFAVVLPLKGTFTSALLVLQLLPNARHAMAHQIAMFSDKPPGTSDPFREHGSLGWAAASSLSVFKGVVKVTARSQVDLLWKIAVSTLFISAAFTFADIEESKSPQYQDYGKETCGSLGAAAGVQQHMCWFAWRYKDVIFIVASNSCLYLVAFSMAIRKELWSPMFLQALRLKGVRWLQRSLWLQWWFLPINFWILYIFVIEIKIVIMKATAAEMIVMSWMSCSYFLVFVTLLFWSLDIDGIVFRTIHKLTLEGFGRPTVLLDSIPEASESSFSSIFRSRKRSAVMPESDIVPQSFFHAVHDSQWRSRAAALGASVLPAQKSASADSSFRHRQVQLLTGMSVLFVLVPTGSWWTFAAVWSFRLLSLLVVLSTSDRHCTLKDIQRKDVSFGLLIDADQLRDVIDAYIHNRPCPYHSIRTFLGTYYRMDDTLTVSYRWQPDVTRLCPGVAINMSSWQLAELAKAITETKCLYVWLDKLALPQKKCKLQQTLLARMMAIYATSKVTLALRSIESDEDRYHQRAWTLQEYCNARNLIVVTQEAEVDEEIEMEASVVGDEDELFPQIRAWHQSRMEACKPMWMMAPGELPDIDMQQAIHHLEIMAPRLVCKVLVDKIRALYPLMFNTPCEDQAELVQLLCIITQPDALKHADSSMSLPSWTKNDAETILVLESEPVPDFAQETDDFQRRWSSDFAINSLTRSESVKSSRRCSTEYPLRGLQQNGSRNLTDFISTSSFYLPKLSHSAVESSSGGLSSACGTGSHPFDVPDNH